MDTYHNENTESGRKVSPFADSPFETAFDVGQSEPHLHKKKSKNTGRRMLSVMLAFLIAVGGCVITAVVSGVYWQDRIATMSVAFQERLDVLQEQIEKKQTSAGASIVKPNADQTPAQVFQNVNQAVVEVTCETVTNVDGMMTEGVFAGSGFLISADGYIVTNYHIIEGAKTTQVTTTDGKSYAAEIVGVDEGNDFALLKIDGENLPCVEFGSSDELAIGDQVVAIGYPLTSGSPTLTVGYISAKDRVVTTEGRTISMLQTDAAINSGNSGGPLLNMKGQVVGITTAKSSGTSSSGAIIEGVGYAIPMDDIRGMIEDLKEFGYITGAYLGVWVRDVSESAQSYGLPAGVFVEDVMDGYCAQKAGLKPQDIIVNLGGYEVKGMTDLTLALRKFKAGQTVTVTVYRSGAPVYLSVTLDAKPQETPAEDTPAEEISPNDKEYQKWYNFFAPFFGD